MRTVGTVSRGIRAPIIREGDDLAAIVAESVLNASKCEGFPLNDVHWERCSGVDGGRISSEG